MINQLVFLLPVFIWLAVLTYYLYKTVDHYQKLVKGSGRENLAKVLDKILEESYLNKTKINEVKANLQKQIDQSV